MNLFLVGTIIFVIIYLFLNWFAKSSSKKIAQFLKRFVGKTSWAHLDIAGVTWSKKGTKFSRPGGTGFGVRLLDEFVRKNYE